MDKSAKGQLQGKNVRVRTRRRSGRSAYVWSLLSIRVGIAMGWFRRILPVSAFPALP